VALVPRPPILDKESQIRIDRPPCAENFGTVVTNLSYDTDMLTGWGKRNFNWEVSGGIQRELAPGMSAELMYYRRWYGNFVLVDDLAIGPADFGSLRHHRASGCTPAGRRRL
jgi:hypothetical protein